MNDIPLDFIDNYLDNARKQLLYYKILAEKTFDQMEDSDLFKTFDPDANSIGIIVQHLSGNMLSRWTSFLTSDGEKSFRERDREFELLIKTRNDMVSAWQKGWQCQNEGMATVTKSNFSTIVTIRGIPHTILEAINRNIAHVSYHIGQIVFIGHVIKGDKWQSLSIPRGQSKAFNDSHFQVDQSHKHWADATIENYEGGSS